MKKQPNFLIVMSDQQRFDTVPPFNRAITPHLDNLFEQGVSFTSSYCPSPHCCPSRASFFSGLYPSEHGVWNNVDVGNRLSTGLFDRVRLFTEDLKENGYTLYFSGKWHISSTENPIDRGFDEQFPNYQMKRSETPNPPANMDEWDCYKPGSAISSFLDYTNNPNGKHMGQLSREGYLPYTFFGEKDDFFHDEAFIEKAETYIHQAADNDNPWLIYVSTNSPHDPYVVPQEFLDLYAAEDITLPANFEDDLTDKPALYQRTRKRFSAFSEQEYKEAIRHYLAFCSYTDSLAGRLISELKRTGQYEDTVIIYLSDHGDYCGEHGLFAKGLPCFDSAYHIPLIFGGGYLKNTQKTVNDFVSMTDLAPTILELAHVKAKNKLSGYSLVPYLEGAAPPAIRNAIFSQSNGNELYGIQRSINNRKWKFVYNGFDFDELYDLEEDPHETRNIANQPEYNELKLHLMKEIWQFAYDHKDVCINPYIMVSLAECGPGVLFENNIQN